MVRSKFPGKPSKIVNRKIVNSSKCTLQQENESTKAAESISYGLAVFNEVFGDNDQVLTAFHGFSPHEVNRAQNVAKKQWEKVLFEYESSGVTHKPEDAIPVRLDPPTPQALCQMEANLDLIGPVGKHTTRAQCHSLSCDAPSDYSRSFTPSKYFSPFKGNLKKRVANRLLQRAKRSSFDGSSSNRMRLNAQFEKNGNPNIPNVLKKFVLPSHSVRSSRVIKPNKRFLDTEENAKDLFAKIANSDHPLKSRTIELKKPRLILDCASELVMLSQSDISFAPLDGPTSRTQTAMNSGAEGKQHWKHVKLGELNVFGAPTIQPSVSSSSKISLWEDDIKLPLQTLSALKSSPSLPSTKSKLILRESKLIVRDPAEALQEGTFSKKPKKVKSSASPVECEVCGAVRFYRLAKQAFKFGINSCEPCRKFVARMIIKARSSENSVSCQKGQGNCAMTVSNKNESITSKIHKCLACWLLICIQRFVSMPEQTRDSLIRMLPANMQGMTVIVPTTSSLSKGSLSQKKKRPRTSNTNRSVKEKSPGSYQLSPSSRKKSQAAVSRMQRKAALASRVNNFCRVREKTVASSLRIQTATRRKASVGNQFEKAEVGKNMSYLKKSQTHSKIAQKPGRKAFSKGLEKGKDGSLRQKLTLEGPRVKHVCRSASIVLGQPMATFPLKNTHSLTTPGSSGIQSDSGPVPGGDASIDISKFKQSSEFGEAQTKNDPLKTVSATPETDISKNTQLENLTPSAPKALEQEKKISLKAPSSSNVPHLVSGRRISALSSNSFHGSVGVLRGHRRTLQALGVYNTQVDTVPDLISLDFWESYDPDEICNTGFGLVGFEPCKFKPVCFLCGSAGKQQLIHCASCCEPYHQFCVEMGVIGNPVPPVMHTTSGRDEWRVDWVCPRCTVCHGCGHSTGHQLTSCQRCHNSYHFECLGSSSLRKNTGDRLWICSSCLRCKSCNSTVVTKFVGNLPFCKVCFKLRQKGNFCPLCQGCYTDDDYQSKMMECAECKAWVHAKCEGLSDEKYQVLSYLPESVEYVCRLCCAFPPAPWWHAVEAELQAGYLNVLKAITKNRKACAMLKWSPQKSCNCQHNVLPVHPKVFNPNISLGKRRLSFNYTDNEMELKVPSSASSKISHKPSGINTYGEVQGRSSVFEFDDDIDAGENVPIMKYVNARDKSKAESIPSEHSTLQLECANECQPPKSSQYSPNAGSQSDSGIGSTDDELKACSAAEEEDADDKKVHLIHVNSNSECECFCRGMKHSIPSLLTVKKKVHSSEYSSLLEFHQDMDQLISEADSHEVKEWYHQTLREVFPWFDPKYTRVSHSSLPASPCKPYHGSLLQHQQGSSPEKNGGSSMKILGSLIPKDVDLSDDSYFYCGLNIEDDRICCFCKQSGDSVPNDEGRLLYCGQNDWVHVNCALWSAEVFEEIDGALQNVSNALSRGRMIRCSECGKKGASVGCCAKKCEETLHFPCARKAGFVFMEDKNVYCPLHKKGAPGKPLVKPSEFDICRPVFVELDRRKKKCVESKHVKVMIGSLFIESLGTIVPEVSDHGSVIIPTQFSCTRLFWSSKEPWRIVQYSIRTTVHIPAPEPILDLGHHVTVDHSKENESDLTDSVGDVKLVETPLKEIFSQSPEEVGINITSVQFGASSESNDMKIVEAVVSQLLDTVCNKETDEEVSDAQNSADLLPPELKDAIFEDLPHDFLDGISLQDIFQDKFLTFEEQTKDDVQEEVIRNEINSGCVKEQHSKDKSKMVKSIKSARELKRSKSDVLPSHTSQTTNRLHQRSCSLAWSCKLGSGISCWKAQTGIPAEGVVDRTRLIQELRLSVKPAPCVGLKYSLQDSGDKGKENHTLSWPRIMQVDGAWDSSCSDSSDAEDILRNDRLINSSHLEIASGKKKDTELCVRLKNITKSTVGSYFKKQECILARRMHKKTPEQVDDQKPVVKKRLTKTWKNCDFERRHSLIPQMDGAADSSSDSEHDSSNAHASVPCTDEKPVRCDKCRCTYRTSESYARHLPSCSGDYSSTTSESEEADVSEDEAGSYKKHIVGCDLNLAPSPDSAISVSSGSLISGPLVSPTTSAAPPPLPAASLTTCPSSLSVSSGSVMPTQPLLTASNSSPIDGKQQSSSSTGVGNVLSSFSVVPNLAHPSKHQTPQESTSSQTVKVLVDGNQTIMQEQSNPPSQQTVEPSPQQHPSVIMVDYQQSQQSGPTVFVQSVPSAAMVPTYLEAYQQHSGHNLQYLTTLDTSGGFGKTQYLAAVPSSVLPGAYQLQAVSDSQLCVDPCTMSISTLPSIQLTPAQVPSTHPQVLGTLIQSSVPCGVVTTAEPMYETIQMYPDQSGGVLLTNQPMLTCMETVVSNTYMSMSSSQFVSSSVPGMLEGSSTFSATTTQVFQSNDVDSPVIDAPAQYVMVNPPAAVCDQRGREIQMLSIQQRNIQKQGAVQTQSQIQIPSINLPLPAALPAPISPQTLPSVIPTSVVPPMPRIQPQRTYSKPSKVNKEVQASRAGGFKSTISSKSNVIGPAKDKKLLQSNSRTIVVLNNAHEYQTLAVKHRENVEKSQLPPKKLTLESNSTSKHTEVFEVVKSQAEPVASPSEFIATNTAPAQSITLPDPIPKVLIDGRHASNITSCRITGASGRCPPVTISYRPPMAAKLKQKTGPSSLSSLSSSNTVLVQSPGTSDLRGHLEPHSSEDISSKSTKLGPSVLILSTKPESLKKSDSPTTVPFCLTNQESKITEKLNGSQILSSSSDGKSASNSGVKKPIATIMPQTQLRPKMPTVNQLNTESYEVTSDLKGVTSGALSDSSANVSVLNAATPLTSATNSYSVFASQSESTTTSKSLIASSASLTSSFSSSGIVCNSNPLLASLISKQSANQTSNSELLISPAITHTAASMSGTTATFSSLKPIICPSSGLKPLQEIKTANVTNVVGNPSPPRNQDKLLLSVPPTVLKSSCHNYDLTIKNDVFSKQGDVPSVFASAEKSPTSSLKLLFQKQSHSGCYKVSSSPVNKDDEVTLVKLGDIMINQKKGGGKDESENVQPAIKASKKSQSNSNLPQLMFEIHGQDGFSYTSTSMSDIWQKVFDAVQEARAKHKMPPLLHNPYGSLESSPNLIGLGNNSLKYLMEQLRRVEDCTKYRPVYHKSRLPAPGYGKEDLESNFKESSTGCARTDPCISLKKYDMFSWLDSRHRCPPKLLESNDFDSMSGGRRSASTNLPMAMRFRHLRETSKTSVGVFRSDIHGRGLFCLRDIEAGEMVIEYAGEVIRNTLTDNRERYYQSKGIDCYMFKVDDNFTVDATQKGNAARFINHSCEPNCYSRVVDIHGKKHIIIFAYRRIPQGEELTYDYKFPIEDVKIACHCLAPRCRKYLN